MGATIKPVPRVNTVKDALTETQEVSETESAIAAGIRELGNPELDELAAALETNAKRSAMVLSKIASKGYNTSPIEEIDRIAVNRVRNGERTGSTSIEEFAEEFGVDPASPR